MIYDWEVPNYALLRLARELRGMTIPQAAKLFKMKSNDFRDLENGFMKEFTKDLAARAAEVFNLRENFFYQSYRPLPAGCFFICKCDFP